jgi:alkyldihydroxyacetonephosphate synthase
MRDMFQAGLRPAVARLYDPFDSFIARLGSLRRKRADKRHGSGEHGPRMPGAGGFAIRGILRAPALLNRAVDVMGEGVLRGARLVLIFEGPAAEGTEDLGHAASIARRRGASDLGEGPARHWLAHRYGVSYRQSPVFMAGAFSDTMEVAAPWSRLAGLYRDVRAALGKRVFVMAHLSHAYPDGCSIYFTFAGSAPTPEAALAKYDATWRDALDAAIAAGGTLSHHHGVGRSKAPKLGAELGLGVDVVRALRGVFDPASILNPGNLLPRESPVRRAPAPAPAVPTLDRASQLVHARGDATLLTIVRALEGEGLTLGFDAYDESVPPLAETTLAAWIARGAHGALDPWIDPVDHVVAGFTARLPSGAELEVRPSPRRAVGPDLFALFLGAGERAGVITSAHVRVRSSDDARALPTTIPRDPPLGADERVWMDRALAAAGAVS